MLDYLSKVGDLAHTTSMSAVERRQLVGRLREEIGRRRSEVDGEESRADVQRILRRIGRPEDVVAARAAEPPVTVPPPGPVPAEGGPPPAPVPAEPQGSRPAPAVPAEPQRSVPEPAGPADGSPFPGPRSAPEELIDESAPEPPPAGGRRDEEPWRDGPIGGFVGGIEEPDMLRPPPEPGGPRPQVPLRKRTDPAGPGEDAAEAPGDGSAADAEDGGAAPGPDAPAAGRRRGRAVRRLRRALGGRHVGGPVELLAVVLLVSGAVVPSLFTMAGGWLLGYWSPRLSRRGAQWAVFGMPGLVLGSYLGWLFGRVNGYWGDQIEGAVLRDALADNYPALLRLSALASALFLLWRALRRPPAAD